MNYNDNSAHQVKKVQNSVILFYTQNHDNSREILLYLAQGDTLLNIRNMMKINLITYNVTKSNYGDISNKFGIKSLPALFIRSSNQIIYNTNDIIDFLNPKRIYAKNMDNPISDEDRVRKQMEAFITQNVDIVKDEQSGRVNMTRPSDEDDSPVGGDIMSDTEIRKRLSQFQTKRKNLNPKLVASDNWSGNSGNSKLRPDYDMNNYDDAFNKGRTNNINNDMLLQHSGNGNIDFNDQFGGGNYDVKNALNDIIKQGGDY